MDLDDDYAEDDEYDYYNEVGVFDEDSEEEGEGPRIWDGGFSHETYCGFIPSFLSRHYPPPPHTYLTQEEADRNARQLVEEEEREKAKANKKRLKKKKQKERRRQQRLQETPGGAPAPEGPPPGEEEEEPEQRAGSVSGSEDDLDLGSTFVRKVQKKMASKPRPERRERPREAAQGRARATGRSQERPATPPPDPQRDLIKMNVLLRYKIQESMELAGMGNNLAKQERFADSLHFYTEALKINPSEYRFLGNRSYSYERLARYNEALADATTALELKPDFLKGFFRKGKALKGLKRYSEAIAAFQQVLLCDSNHVEAAQEIAQCQHHLQESMAGIRVKILSNAPLSPAATPLPVHGHNQKVFVSRNIYNTKSATTRDPTPPPGRPVTGATQSKLFPIWVGNVTAAVTEELLRDVFEPFGSLLSIRMLHSRTCAFVNFTDKEAAESAFSTVQGLQVGGSTLVLQLRNPEHSAATRKK